MGISFAVGFITGAQGITFAHELGHRQSNFDRLMVYLTSVNYGHFMVEHHARRTPPPPVGAYDFYPVPCLAVSSMAGA
ncbi:MAG: hypothetical protein IPI14_12805 [Polaromonas sp.]|nr:hypothetical protein [Polaromonas sp.]